MKYRWMPLFGHFEERKSSVVFKGAWEEPRSLDQSGTTTDVPPRVPSIGVNLSDQMISDGTVSADITFAAVGRNTGCEFVIGFDIETRSYLTAGISGFHDAMFTIREWVPWAQNPGEQPRWNTYSGGGDRANLKPRRKYAVRVDVSGSRVELAIDGVPVAAATVPPNPKRRRHVDCGASITVTSQSTTFIFAVVGHVPLS